MLEVFGHDHIADLRYHKGPLPFSEDHEELTVDEILSRNNTNDFKFHNIVLAPGVTSNRGQNPGFAMFKIDHHNAHSLKMIFFPID